jgi:hypothetical protein
MEVRNISNYPVTIEGHRIESDESVEVDLDRERLDSVKRLVFEEADDDTDDDDADDSSKPKEKQEKEGDE